MPVSVSIENLKYSYTPGKPVLRNISLQVAKGEKLGIIGPSGSGKSTLLLHLNGVLRGDGRIVIGDVPVTKDSIHEIRRKVGLVFQNPDDQLFNPTVEEDVAFGPLNFGFSPEEAASRVREALRIMHLDGFEKLTSHHLSFGERKRVALATVLAMQPEVIALDEPFSNLDPAMVQELMEKLSSMDTTLVIVSQSILPLIAICDRIAILKDGEIIAVDQPKKLAGNQELMRSSGLDIEYYCKICNELYCGK
jgi:cobalt/nickel transport system ATP-binding protein